MKNDGVPRSGGFFSLRTISSYLRIVSSGASTVASTVRSAGASVASSIAEHDDDAVRDQVHWAGFDKLECGDDVLRQVLLLGYKSGFQVWDVEDANDVRQLVARHDGNVSFLQMQKKPIERCEDKFADVRPLLAVAMDGSFSASGQNTDGVGPPCNGSVGNCQEMGNDYMLPTSVHFYSLKVHDYVHVLKFRTPVYSIRCSPRVVAVSQAAQIHFFNAATLDREYTILTCPINCHGSGGIGCSPLALGSRWFAYSGSPVVVSNAARVSPQHLTSVTALSPSPLNGSLVAHCAKESSKQLAAGIVTLGDMGYKKLSKYIPNNSTSMKHRNSSLKTNGTINGQLSDTENVGMVVVRDIVSKSVVVQFRAHKSSISVLAFDPSGTLLVTASVHGHNLNVFSIMPSLCGNSSESDATGTCIHLYRLQRGFTDAVIQNISFSDDSQWIMISSSRGTSHLFSISPGATGDLQFSDVDFTNGSYGSDRKARSAVRWPHSSDPSKLNHQTLSPSGSPITLSVVSRIKNGNGWKGAVSGAAAAATGRISPLSGAITSVFHNCKGSNLHPDTSSSRTKYYLLVFSPSGCIIQYVLHHSTSEDSGIDMSRLSTVSHGSLHETDSRLVVQALQKWDVCHKRNRRDRGDNVDIYGEHGNGESTKLFQKGTKKGTSIYPADSGSDLKVKLTAGENHNIYISEVELQSHSSRVPIWAKSKIHFQVMVDENIKGKTSALGGEIEIERIPTRTIEARTKDLIPVFDYFHTPRFEQARENGIDKSRNGLLIQQKSGLSEDGRHSRRSSCSSLDCATECAAVAELPNGFNDCAPECAAVVELLNGFNNCAPELPNGFNENCWGDSCPLAEANEGSVNNGMESPMMKDQLECVNNRGALKKAELEHVYSKESLKMESQFEGCGNEIN